MRRLVCRVPGVGLSWFSAVSFGSLVSIDGFGACCAPFPSPCTARGPALALICSGGVVVLLLLLLFFPFPFPCLTLQALAGLSALALIVKCCPRSLL